jgi:hypothetical protein
MPVVLPRHSAQGLGGSLLQFGDPYLEGFYQHLQKISHRLPGIGENELNRHGEIASEDSVKTVFPIRE